MKESPSQEYLNAFVDGELAAGEREEAMAHLEDDPAFKSAVCELRVMKELVRGAYADLPSGHKARPFSCPPVWRQAMVAGLFLILGLGGGWFAHGVPAPDRVERLAGLPGGYMPISLSDRVDSDKIVLHLDSSDPARIDAVLDLAGRLLDQRGAQAQVEIVVNSSGLNLLRQDISPYRGRIASLSRHYGNLAFLACGQTMARLKQEGVDVVLVPEAGVASSAINEILTRMSQGWVYVKV
ncbi:MAG: zf-HC2 domain-containing protein [Gallionellaceae bacterium]|nr:zf-HC2 domain-containing protein [Gallionellaceae bacterium]MDD5366160.1 zf-HC2 domain-containing protein [Gallionellaceae bacterium]